MSWDFTNDPEGANAWIEAPWVRESVPRSFNEEVRE